MRAIIGGAEPRPSLNGFRQRRWDLYEPGPSIRIQAIGSIAILWLHVLASTALWAQIDSASRSDSAELSIQTGQSGKITSIEFSSDGKFLLTGNGDGTACLWDTETGYQLRKFSGHSSNVNHASVSRDGRYVLTASSDGTARLWDVYTEAEVKRFVGHKEGVSSAVFSEDEKRIYTADDDGVVRVYDAHAGDQIALFEGHKGRLNSLVLSHDGQRMLTASADGTARLWDTNSRKEIQKFILVDRPDNLDRPVAVFTADERQILTASTLPGSSFILWQVDSGIEVHRYKWRPLYGNIAFSPDGRRVLVGSVSGTAVMYDFPSGEEIRSLDANDGNVMTTQVTFSPNGKIMAASGSGTARIWNSTTGTQIQEFSSPFSSIYSVTFSSTSRHFVAATDDGSARLWSLDTGGEIGVYRGHSGPVSTITFSRDGKSLLTGGEDGTVRVWDVFSATERQHLEAATKPITIVQFSPDERQILTSSLDHTAKLWDRKSGTEMVNFDDVAGWFRSAQFSPNSRFLVTAQMGGKTFILWNALNGKRIRLLTESSIPYRYPAGNVAKGEAWESTGIVAYSPDGHRLLTAGGGEVASVWTSDGKRQLFKMGTFSKSSWEKSFAIAGFLRDGHYMYTLNAAEGKNQGALLIRDSFTGREVRRYEQVHIPVFPLRGTRIVLTRTDGTATLEDFKSGATILKFSSSTGTVNFATFFGADKFVLTGGGWRDAIKLWEADSGKQIASIVAFKNGGYAVVAPDGRFDTSEIEGTEALRWTLRKDPMHPLPLEIFMRDYYTPGLLSRLINHETFPPVRPISDILNRHQPEVRIVSVSPSIGRAGRVDVVVYAASRVTADGQIGGLQDLRLFRDGQIVAGGYRDGSLTDGEYTFREVMVKSKAEKITFSAYAFNSERIKSRTATLVYTSQTFATVISSTRKAYLLQIGVDHYKASDCELNYSSADADKLSSVLSERLSTNGYEVHAKKLKSILAAHDISGASKQAFRDQLALIASRATPDDIVLLSFSGHGYAAKDGSFYILPSDTSGSCVHVDKSMLRTAISADELAEWLRPVDASELVLILDTCFSAESIEADGFKPGPLGSRGLGQLAYDKRMRVLAASQADSVAAEYPYLGGGLLTYMLVDEGLLKRKADWKPVDNRITIGEWLAYAADAVPKFSPTGRKVEIKRTVVLEPAFNSKRDRQAQTPALFDFSRSDGLRLE